MTVRNDILIKSLAYIGNSNIKEIKVYKSKDEYGSLNSIVIYVEDDYYTPEELINMSNYMTKLYCSNNYLIDYIRI